MTYIKNVWRDEEIITDSKMNHIENGIEKIDKKTTELSSDLAHIANKGTTVEVLERVTKEEIDRQVADGTIANLTITNNSISPLKTNFFKNFSNNLFNKEDVEYGYFLGIDGVKYDNPNFFTSNFIEVKESTIHMSNEVRFAVFYDENKEALGFGVDNGAFGICYINTNEKTKYIKVSSNITRINNLQINVGNKLLPYEEYNYKLPLNMIEKNNTILEPVNINIPNKLYKLEGQPFNIFFDNIIGDYNDYYVDVNCNTGIHYENRVGSFNIANDTPISFSVYDKQQNLLNNVNSTIKHIPSTNGNNKTKKCLFIGDSTTDAGAYTQKLLDLFSSDVMDIELLGTRGNGLNKHEGRSGWTSANYCKTQQQGDKVNAFYNSSNSSFDFSYYMSQQNYANVDYVFIHLGINDIFIFNTIDELNDNIDNIINNFNTIINSIKSYNYDIKVCILLTIPPNASQFAFGSTYGCGQSRWRYKSNYHVWVDKLIKTYDNRENENIYVVPVNTILDTTVDINDAVHPKKDITDIGYNKMALPIYYFIKYLGGL